MACTTGYFCKNSNLECDKYRMLSRFHITKSHTSAVSEWVMSRKALFLVYTGMAFSFHVNAWQVGPKSKYDLDLVMKPLMLVYQEQCQNEYTGFTQHRLLHERTIHAVSVNREQGMHAHKIYFRQLERGTGLIYLRHRCQNWSRHVFNAFVSPLRVSATNAFFPHCNKTLWSIYLCGCFPSMWSFCIT